jgi:hypothetical protein
VRGIEIMVAAAVLGGCTPSASAKLAAQLAAEKAALRPVRPFPIAPDAMRAGDVRAKAGDFVIYPNTQFCGLGIMEPKVAAAIDPADPERVMRTFPIRTGDDYQKVVKLGLSVGTQDGFASSRYNSAHMGNPREVGQLIATCPDNAVNIMLTHHVELNATGNPYRVTLTARQGSKFWSASVERTPTSADPKVTLMYNDKPLPLKINADGLNLQKRFESVLFGGDR